MLILSISKLEIYNPILNLNFLWHSFVLFPCWFVCTEGKKLAIEHDCKFIETSSGIQHNVDELLVGVLKQIRLREDLDKKRRKKKLMGSGSRTSLSLGVARDILQKMCLQDNRSKSCENLLVLWNPLCFPISFLLKHHSPFYGCPFSFLRR